MKAEFMGTIDMTKSTNEATGYMYPTGAPKPVETAIKIFLLFKRKNRTLKISRLHLMLPRPIPLHNHKGIRDITL